MVEKEVRAAEEYNRQAAAVAMKKHGSSLKWEGVHARNVSWNDMLMMDQHRLSATSCL